MSEAASEPLLAVAGADCPAARAAAAALSEAMPDAFVPGAGPATDTPLPDAALWIAGKTGLPPAPELVELRARARHAGVFLPLVVVADGPVAVSPPVDAVLPAAFPAPLMAARLAEIVRQSVRIEEAALRRAAFGRDPFAGMALAARNPDVPSTRIPVLVAGNGARIAAALATSLDAFEVAGALSIDAAFDQLGTRNFRLLATDLPSARATDLVERLRRDPRHVALPVLALTEADADLAALLAAGASDAVRGDVAAGDLGLRLRLQIRAGARRALADTALARYRRVGPRGATPLPRTGFETYLAGLERVLRARGRQPVRLSLERVSLPDGRPPLAANDDPFASAPGNPVRSAALAASRDEDFVATVADTGDLALLRNAQARERIERRIAAIVASTSFA